MKYWLERNARDGQMGDEGSSRVNSESSLGDCRKRQVGLVDPNELTFRLHCCAAFFRALGQNSPTDEERSTSVKNSVRRTYLSILNDMASVGFVPTPIRFAYFDPRDCNSISEPVNKLSPAECDEEYGDDDSDGAIDDDGDENDDL